MKFNDFEFIIASPTDKEKLICELYYKKKLFAEISQENELIIEIYTVQNDLYWSIPFSELQDALSRAKDFLLNN